MDIVLILPLVVSFLISLIVIPFWINKANSIGLSWPDMNKLSDKKIAGSGGIVVVLAFVISIFLFIAYRTFILETQDFLVEILAMLTSVILLSAIGVIDDLLGWQKGGLRRRHRILLVFMAAIPLMVINAGKSNVYLPFFGNLDLGLLYPLIIIPIGIVGATTTFNFLAGFNGLEAGQGILILSGIAWVSFLTGNSWITAISLCMVASLLAFLIFNFYPAKVFPGDSLTYGVGGLIAILPILGNFERIAVFFFIPVIFEFFLKVRGKLVKQSFGKPNLDGGLDMKYDKIYGLSHLSIFLIKRLGGRPTEKKVVYLIWLIQLAFIVGGIIIFGRNIV